MRTSTDDNFRMIRISQENQIETTRGSKDHDMEIQVDLSKKSLGSNNGFSTISDKRLLKIKGEGDMKSDE